MQVTVFIQPIQLYRHLRHKEAPPKRVRGKSKSKSVGLLGIGATTGIMSGLFGMGGGNVVIPLLTTILKYPTKRAIATSLGAMLPPIGLPGVIYHYNAGNLDLNVDLYLRLVCFWGRFLGRVLR